MYERSLPARQIYVSCAVLAFAASWVPLYVPEEPGDLYSTLTIWSSIPRYGSVLGVVAVALVLGLVASSLAACTSRPTTRKAPVATFVLTLPAMTMIVSRAGEGSNSPSLGAGAGLLLGTTIALALTAASDVWFSLWVEPIEATLQQ